MFIPDTSIVRWLKGTKLDNVESSSTVTPLSSFIEPINEEFREGEKSYFPEGETSTVPEMVRLINKLKIGLKQVQT